MKDRSRVKAGGRVEPGEKRPFRVIDPLELLAFLPVLGPLFPVWFAYSGVTSFSFSFFLGGILVEQMLSLLIRLAYARRWLQYGARRQMDYMLRMIIGLPLTTYMAAMSPHSYISLLRLLPQVFYFRLHFGVMASAGGGLLFMIGLVFLTMMRTDLRPEWGDLVMIVFYLFAYPLVFAAGQIAGRVRIASMRWKVLERRRR